LQRSFEENSQDSGIFELDESISEPKEFTAREVVAPMEKLWYLDFSRETVKSSSASY
jgi:hypothetical protein